MRWTLYKALLLPATLLLFSTAAAGDDRSDDDKPAQSGRRDAERQGDRGQRFREEMLKRFDEDRDGRLSESEREKARQAMRRHREERSRHGDPPHGWRNEKDSRAGRHGPPGDPRAGRGPHGHGPRFHMAVFERIDRDGDGSISKKEWTSAVERMRHSGFMPMHGEKHHRHHGHWSDRHGEKRLDKHGDHQRKKDGDSRGDHGKKRGDSDKDDDGKDDKED